MSILLLFFPDQPALPLLIFGHDILSLSLASLKFVTAPS